MSLASAYLAKYPHKRPTKKGSVGSEISKGGGSLVGNVLVDLKKKEVEKLSPGTLDRKVKPDFVPMGFDQSMFSLNPSKINSGQLVRRNVLDATAPRLQDAIASGDIFAYNAALANMRTMISRTEGGPELPSEMPDPEEIRRRARLKRRQIGSREQTLNLGLI